MEKYLLTVYMFLAMASHCSAQFYTIGNVHGQRIGKTNESPLESHDTQKDYVHDSSNISLQKDSVCERIGEKEKIDLFPYVSFPLEKLHINSGFGMRVHPVYKKKMMHNGVDLRARHERVLSILPGKVIKVAYDGRSGNYVTVKSADYTISYCHLAKQYVKVNDNVPAGTPVGLSGNTGASTGEHLHLTTKLKGKAINPMIILDYVKKVLGK